jgi:hypothetical protein
MSFEAPLAKDGASFLLPNWLIISHIYCLTAIIGG